MIPACWVTSFNRKEGSLAEFPPSAWGGSRCAIAAIAEFSRKVRRFKADSPSRYEWRRLLARRFCLYRGGARGFRGGLGRGLRSAPAPVRSPCLVFHEGCVAKIRVRGGLARDWLCRLGSGWRTGAG